jgi:hypothetical protein
MTVDEFKEKVRLASNNLISCELISVSNQYCTNYGFYFFTYYEGTRYNLGHVTTNSTTNGEVDYVCVDRYAFSAKPKYNKKEKKLVMEKKIVLDGLIEFSKDFENAIAVISEMQEYIFYMGGL